MLNLGLMAWFTVNFLKSQYFDGLMGKVLIAGCVILKDNKILLIRKKDRNIWELPGGRSKEGAEEQTALEKTADQIGVAPQLVQQFTILEFQKDGLNIEAPIFECTVEPDAVFLPGETVEEVKWFDKDSLKKEDIGNDVAAILEEL